MFMYARRHNKAHTKNKEGTKKGKSCSKIPEIHVNLDNLKYKRKKRSKINCVN